MKIPNNIVLQPYGKNDVSMNFIVSPTGKWLFGPSDIDKIDVLKSTAHVFNYVKFSAINPKYYIRPIPNDFIIKNKSLNIKKLKLTHDTDKCKSIFFFLFYEPKGNFCAMNYTVDEKEYDKVESSLNIISTIVFYGKKFIVSDESWDTGVTTKPEDVKIIIEEMRNDR